MTNYERYESEIERITRLGYKIAVDKNTDKPCACNTFRCCDCIANEINCFKTISQWADTEYIESKVDWSKVLVDTPILVSNDEKRWVCRYFAKLFNEKVYAFDSGVTSWSTENGFISSWAYAKLAEVKDE